MRLMIFFCSILCIAIYGCQIDSNPCSLSKETLKDINRLDSITSIPKIRERDSEMMKSNYNEPSLLEASNETYRFILSSSFDGSIVYRIEKKGDDYLAIKKRFYDNSDTIGNLKDLEFSDDDWIRLTNELKANCFWTYLTSTGRRVLDGSSWRLEGYKPIKDECTKKNYHYVYRVSSMDTTFVSMCNLFRNLKEKKSILNYNSLFIQIPQENNDL